MTAGRWPQAAGRRVLAGLPAVFVAACATGGRQSALDPAGPQAGRIATFYVFLLVVSAIVYVIVIAALAFSVLRTRRTTDERSETRKEHVMRRGVLATGIASAVILFVFLFYDFGVGRAVTEIPTRDPLEIEVIGHQWWWEVKYPSPLASNAVVTANEIHVPVGVPVRFRLTSTDVIHSFWAPNLHGKKDLVPGHVARTWFQADTAGVYRGQCAEFCGLQHAKMAFIIVAETKDEFRTWLEAQRQPASEPSDSLRAWGQRVFLGNSCTLCHTIAGTYAQSNVGPDLTHIASRGTIAAGTLLNTRGNMAGWIMDPQGIKPGTRMPSNQLTPDDLKALLAYLEGLK